MSIEEYDTKIEQLREWTLDQWHMTLSRGVCPIPTELLVDVPLGMFRCEVCGTMVVAGCNHGPIDPPWDPQQNTMAQAFYEAHPELYGVLWQEDDIDSPDHETIDEALKRLFGKPFDRDNWLAKMSISDGLQYIMEEAIVRVSNSRWSIHKRPALLTPENTALCRRLAIWQNGYYRVDIHAGGDIIERLGSVSLRADTRWNWWRWKSRYHQWNIGQGVCDSKQQAKDRVLEGWNEP